MAKYSAYSWTAKGVRAKRYRKKKVAQKTARSVKGWRAIIKKQYPKGKKPYWTIIKGK